jgi:quinol monooxygenase YgiN
MQVALIGSIRFPAQSLPALDAPLRAMVEATRREEGCLFYSLAPDPTDPCRVTVAEVFRDADALAAHRASGHMAVWREACAELGLHDRRMMVYDAADPRPR